VRLSQALQNVGVTQKKDAGKSTTYATRIFSPLLYQLSCLALFEPRIEQARLRIVNE
jgi:hypothetical protein